MVKRISLRTIFFSLFLSMGLWAYVSLRSTYEYATDIPLFINVATDRSIENYIPQTIRVKVKGTGWSLMNMLYLNKSASVDIRITSKSNTYTITQSELRQSFHASVPVTVSDIYPTTLPVNIGIITEKRVPLYADVTIFPADGFIQTSNIRLSHDSVTIRGNSKLIQSIQSWKTSRINFENQYESIQQVINVSDSLNRNISITPSSVALNAGIEQMAETTIHDVPISVVNPNSVSSKHTINPTKLSITVRGGISTVSTLNASSFQAFVSGESITNDTTGSVKPTIVAPKSLRIIKTTPKTLSNRRIISDFATR
jgi:hypothetical protein